MTTRPVRVFFSRFNTDIGPGEGHMINWEIGEHVRVISGLDKGREFVVLTEGRAHPDLPYNEYAREGYFADDPARTRWAKPERTLWYL